MTRIVAWNVVLLMMVVAFAELAFGGWLDSMRAPALWRLSIYRNVEWALSAAAQYGRPDAVIYRRDRFGLRGRYGKPDDIGILILGGSTTDERFVGENETWTDVFSRCLADAGHKVGVANAGIAGQSTRGHARNFEVWLNNIPGLKPRYILAYIGVNERLLKGRANEDDAAQYNETGWPLWIERLKLNSALYALYRTGAGNWTAWRAGVHHLSTDGSPSNTATLRVNRRWRDSSAESLTVNSEEHARRRAAAKTSLGDELGAYAERLTKLVQAVRDFGADPILITQTDSTFRISNGVVRGEIENYISLRAFNDVTMDICARHNLRCVDLGSMFQTTDGDFYDNVHMTPQGSRKTGELICRALITDPGFTP